MHSVAGVVKRFPVDRRISCTLSRSNKHRRSYERNPRRRHHPRRPRCLGQVKSGLAQAIRNILAPTHRPRQPPLSWAPGAKIKFINVSRHEMPRPGCLFPSYLPPPRAFANIPRSPHPMQGKTSRHPSPARAKQTQATSKNYHVGACLHPSPALATADASIPETETNTKSSRGGDTARVSNPPKHTIPS